MVKLSPQPILAALRCQSWGRIWKINLRRSPQLSRTTTSTRPTLLNWRASHVGPPKARVIPRVVRAFGAFRHMPRVASAFARMQPRMARNHARFSPKTAYTLKYCTSYARAYLMKRGLFLPEEVASIVGDEVAREGLARLGILESIREAMTPDPGTPFARVAALESALFMRNQLLRDIDWASMAHSLEVRVPLVDAFLLRQVAPAVFSTSKRNGKELMARAPRQPLPEAIVKRKKTGFTVPIRDWLTEHRDVTKHFGMRPWALYVLETGGHTSDVSPTLAMTSD